MQNRIQSPEKRSFLIYHKKFRSDFLFIELWVFCRERMIVEIDFEPTLVEIFSLSVEDIVMSVSTYLIRIIRLSGEEMQSISKASGLLYQILKFLPNIAYARVGCGSNNMRQTCQSFTAISVFLFFHLDSLSLRKYQFVYSWQIQIYAEKKTCFFVFELNSFFVFENFNPCVQLFEIFFLFYLMKVFAIFLLDSFSTGSSGTPSLTQFFSHGNIGSGQN